MYRSCMCARECGHIDLHDDDDVGDRRGDEGGRQLAPKGAVDDEGADHAESDDGDEQRREDLE